MEREYSRHEETPRSWPFALLSDTAGSSSKSPFYQMSQFKLRHQEPITFDDNLYISSNYFSQDWDGLRRLKNVIMVA